VSGQLHASAALAPGKDLPVPTEYEVWWTPSIVQVAGVIFSDISLLSDRSRDRAVGIATGYGLDDRGVRV
jgi:hypothetical protein